MRNEEENNGCIFDASSKFTMQVASLSGEKYVNLNVLLQILVTPCWNWNTGS